MPGYVSNISSKFQHDAPKHPQHTLSWYVMPVYIAKTQYTTKDETPPLTAQQCLTIQKVTGSILYYARAVDPTVLMPLNDIATEQTKATGKMQAATSQLLDYLATHPDSTIRYHASDMILHIHSDASYDKLLPLPQPPVRARTDARTNPSAQRATQLRRVLARVHAVSMQNQITNTVP
jgi:hypothetical protein